MPGHNIKNTKSAGRAFTSEAGFYHSDLRDPLLAYRRDVDQSGNVKGLSADRERELSQRIMSRWEHLSNIIKSLPVTADAIIQAYQDYLEDPDVGIPVLDIPATFEANHDPSEHKASYEEKREAAILALKLAALALQHKDRWDVKKQAEIMSPLVLSTSFVSKTAEQIRVSKDTEIPREVRHDLVSSLARFQEARNELVENNLAIVLKLSRSYIERGVPRIDIIQEGNLGLMRAAEKFDYRRGYRFSTYALDWVRSYMGSITANYGRTVEIPEYTVARLYRLNVIETELSRELGREPSRRELFDRLDFTREEFNKLLAWRQQETSFDAPLSNEDGESRTLLDNFADAAEGKDEAFGHLMAVKVVNEVLRGFDGRKRDMVARLYGLDGQPETPAPEIARHYGVSRQIVYRAKLEVERKIREKHPHLQELLHD